MQIWVLQCPCYRLAGKKNWLRGSRTFKKYYVVHKAYILRQGPVLNVSVCLWLCLPWIKLKHFLHLTSLPILMYFYPVLNRPLIFKYMQDDPCCCDIQPFIHSFLTGLSAWETEEAILATVLAQSQQEYLDILRRPSQTEDDDDDSSWPLTHILKAYVLTWLVFR